MMPVLHTLTLLAACSDYTIQEKQNKNGQPIDSAAPPTIGPVAITGPGAKVFRSESLQLDGTASYDPDHVDGKLTYAWEVLESPEGSSPILTDADKAKPSFSADLLGVYVIGLTVTDTDGYVSENPAQTAVEVIPWQDLYARLTWDTAKLDLDLHMVEPSGAYFAASDCFFANPTPDWGVEGDGTDNPQLSYDSEGDNEPEDLNFVQPQEGTYTFYVTYYNPRDAKTTYATPTLHVEAHGQVLADVDGPRLTEEGQVWVAGTLEWSTLTWTASSDVTTHDALGGPEYNKD